MLCCPGRHPRGSSLISKPYHRYWCILIRKIMHRWCHVTLSEALFHDCTINALFHELTVNILPHMIDFLFNTLSINNNIFLFKLIFSIILETDYIVFQMLPRDNCPQNNCLCSSLFIILIRYPFHFISLQMKNFSILDAERAKNSRDMCRSQPLETFDGISPFFTVCCFTVFSLRWCVVAKW